MKLKIKSFLFRLGPGFLLISIIFIVLGFVSKNAGERPAKTVNIESASIDLVGIGMQNILPDTPKVISPANNLVINGESALFAWHSTGDNNSYELLYSWNRDFDSPESLIVDATVCCINFVNQMPSSLFCKIRTITAIEVSSAWSSVHHLNFNPLSGSW